MRYHVTVDVDGEPHGMSVEVAARGHAEAAGLEAMERLFEARGWMWEDMGVVAVENDSRSFVPRDAGRMRVAA